MAHHQRKVKLLNHFEISPPPASVPSTSIPLSCFDIPFLLFEPSQLIFFYEFPHSTTHFMQAILPTLTHSLSLTLQHFFPLAATLICPPKPHKPHILYQDGDSISLTVAETNSDLASFISESRPRDFRELEPFVPEFRPPHILEDGTSLAPLMAIQATILSGSGLAICFKFNHGVADGRAFYCFLKFWTTLCRIEGGLARNSCTGHVHCGDVHCANGPYKCFVSQSLESKINVIHAEISQGLMKNSYMNPVNCRSDERDTHHHECGLHYISDSSGKYCMCVSPKLGMNPVDTRNFLDLAGLEGSLPFHNRSIMHDQKELELYFLKEWWNRSPEQRKDTRNHDSLAEMVRETFLLSRVHIEKMKKWLSLNGTSNKQEKLDITTFVTVCSLLWVCLVKSEPKEFNSYQFAFVVDCRNCLNFPIPSTYFGNCVVSHSVRLKRKELVGANAIVVAAKVIGKKVKEIMEGGVFEGAEKWIEDALDSKKLGQHRFAAAGSMKWDAYAVDFGWGRPKKIEVVNLELGGEVSLARGREGGVEVGLALGRAQMKDFSNILRNTLMHLDGEILETNSFLAKI